MMKELIESLGVPGTAYVALAEPQVAACECLLDDTRGIEANIPGTVAVDADIGFFQQIGDKTLG